MEQGSTYAKIMIETLLNVHALTCMHRSSGNEEHRKSAAAWLPQLRSQLRSLEHELLKEPVTEKTCERCLGQRWLGSPDQICGSCQGTGKVKI